MPNNPQDNEGNETTEGVSLWGTCGDEFFLPGTLWMALLNLAQAFGWIPAGTDPPDPIAIELAGLPESECLGLDRSYYPARCQVMTRIDAQSFALGLEQALLDIPAIESAQDRLFASWDDTGPQPSLSTLERLGSVKSILRDLIIHCRECSELWIC